MANSSKATSTSTVVQHPFRRRRKVSKPKTLTVNCHRMGTASGRVDLVSNFRLGRSVGIATPMCLYSLLHDRSRASTSAANRFHHRRVGHHRRVPSVAHRRRKTVVSDAAQKRAAQRRAAQKRVLHVQTMSRLSHPTLWPVPLDLFDSPTKTSLLYRIRMTL